jgi:glycerophosphoryl diester phosphodiesterase
MDPTRLVAVAAAAAAVPGIHAHRGGSVLNGAPTYPENTMPAFQHSSREGYVLEMDAKLTKDRVPVVIHDATLDRTTTCDGEVQDFTRGRLLANCKADVLGSPGSGLPTRPAPRPVTLSTLAEVLALAKREGAVANLEIKNVPTDPDFDSGSSFANRVMDVVVAAGLPRSKLIIQSFWPPNLTVARSRLPGVQTSLLTLSALNSGGPSFAAANGHRWVSPEWPVDSDYVTGAHSLGRLVVPYTLDKAAEVRSAAGIGVNALITDDPLMAQRALSLRRSQLVPDRIRPTVRLLAPRYASDVSRSRRFRVRWRGSDRGSGIARYRLEVRRSTNVSTRWVPLAATTRRRTASFRGRAGVTYLFRLRARDRFGNLSRFDYDKTVVPRDDRSRRLRLSGDWRRIRRRGAYGRTLTRVRGAGASASIAFRGTQVAVIVRRSPRAGRLLVTLGRRSKVVVLRARARHRRVVFRSRRLPSSRHLLVLRALGGGVVDLDAIGIDTGPGPPRR